MKSSSESEYVFHDLQPAAHDIAAEVLAGLSSQPKSISPKYFYDAEGSALFEAITELPEYYLTRTEMALLDAYLGEVAALLPAEICVLEYGSGSSLKIRKLLEALTPKSYVPVDISWQHLQENAKVLHHDYPHVSVYPVCADITRPFELPEAVAATAKLAFFPGSSIGNFSPADAAAFLHNVHDAVGEDGMLLIGVDRKKPVPVLEQAYDDAAGVTARFNLNALAHVNKVMDGNFDLQSFAHVARYNDISGCIQMFLRSTRAQQVTVAGQTIKFAAGEEIHTENSYKYRPAEFLALAESAGFVEVQQWTDEREWFSLYLLKVKPK